MNQDNAAIRKRTQISKANRAMFLWIAAASALIGAALVVSFFMAQKLIYNEKVLAAKQTTVTNLTHNIDIVETLEEEIRILDTNQALTSVKANPSDQALQVILDALPAEANSLALGASLQNKLLAGIGGLTVESLQVTPVVGVETLTGSKTRSTKSSANVIKFQFSVSGSDAALKQALENLERSIRTIKVSSVRIEMRSSGPTMVVQGQAYYEPAKTIQLEKKKVEP